MHKEVKTVVRTVLISEGIYTGTVAVGKRAEGSSNAGKWCLFGGKAEKHKWRKKEAMREVVEETGLSEEDLAEIDEPLFVHQIQRTIEETTWRNRYYFMEFDPCLIPALLESFNRTEFSEVEFMEGEGEMEGKEFAYPSDIVILRWFFNEIGN